MNNDIPPGATQDLAKSDEKASKAHVAIKENQDLKQEAQLNIMSKRSSVSSLVDKKKGNSNRGSLE